MILLIKEQISSRVSCMINLIVNAAILRLLNCEKIEILQNYFWVRSWWVNMSTYIRRCLTSSFQYTLFFSQYSSLLSFFNSIFTFFASYAWYTGYNIFWHQSLKSQILSRSNVSSIYREAWASENLETLGQAILQVGHLDSQLAL